MGVRTSAPPGRGRSVPVVERGVGAARGAPGGCALVRRRQRPCGAACASGIGQGRRRQPFGAAAVRPRFNSLPFGRVRDRRLGSAKERRELGRFETTGTGPPSAAGRQRPRLLMGIGDPRGPSREFRRGDPEWFDWRAGRRGTGGGQGPGSGLNWDRSLNIAQTKELRARRAAPLDWTATAPPAARFLRRRLPAGNLNHAGARLARAASLSLHKRGASCYRCGGAARRRRSKRGNVSRVPRPVDGSSWRLTTDEALQPME